MPTMQQQREKLVELLEQLFQLNQPDLDFGFYRIMHAKAKEVKRFLRDDLLQIVQSAFGQHNEARVAELREAYEKEVETAKQYDAPNPEGTPRVKEAKERWEAATDTSKAEGEVYDHLYRFFERYYDNGDFISLRYLTRETPGKAAPYAVPYNGEEVKLHWANADQYYIKTTQYFTNFTFDLTKAKEVVEHHGELFGTKEVSPLRVHFRAVAASEGEHGDIKATTDQKRYFLLYTANPVALENGELIVHFEYRPDPDKTGQDGVWQAKRSEEAVAAIFEALQKLKDAKDSLSLTDACSY